MHYHDGHLRRKSSCWSFTNDSKSCGKKNQRQVSAWICHSSSRKPMTSKVQVGKLLASLKTRFDMVWSVSNHVPVWNCHLWSINIQVVRAPALLEPRAFPATPSPAKGSPGIYDPTVPDGASGATVSVDLSPFPKSSPNFIWKTLENHRFWPIPVCVCPVAVFVCRLLDVQIFELLQETSGGRLWIHAMLKTLFGWLSLLHIIK